MKHLKDFRATTETVQEATDLYNKGGIQITRYSAGKGKLGVQVSTGFKKFIQLTEPQMKTLAQILPKIQKDLRKDLKANNMDPSDDAENGDDVNEGMDGRTSEYKAHRAKLEAQRARRTENNFIYAAKMAKKNGEKTFTIGGKQYDVEEALSKEKKEGYGAIPKKKKDAEAYHHDKKKKVLDDDASNDKSDDGDGLDKVDPKAAKKKFADRKDKDIDNDGDVDDSDKFLHKRRKAIGKSMKDEPKGEKGETATMNPKKDTKESTIRQRLLSIWEDAAGEKRKKDQNKDKGDSNLSNSDKKMKDGHGAAQEMGPETGEKSVDAGKAVKGQAKARNSGDAVKSGDQNVINKVKEAYLSMYEEKSDELEESILTKNTWGKHSAWKKAHNALQKMEKQFKGTPKEDEYYEVLNGLYHAVSDWSDEMAADNPWSTKTATKSSYAKGDDPAAMLRKDFKDLLGKDAKKFMA